MLMAIKSHGPLYVTSLQWEMLTMASCYKEYAAIQLSSSHHFVVSAAGALTVYHFGGPFLIVADTGVSKIKVMALKSKQNAVLLREFGQKHIISSNKYLKQYLNIYIYKKFTKFHESFCAKMSSSRYSMVFGNSENVPWNSMELWIWTKFHGILRNFSVCCSSSMEFPGTTNAVRIQKVPWKSGGSSMYFFYQYKFQSCLKRYFE